MTTRRIASDSRYLIQEQTIYSGDNNQSITLEEPDVGGTNGFMAMASAMAPESETETDHGYDKTCTAGGNLVHEQRDNQSKSSVIVGKRFTVKANGSADSIDQLKQAVASADLGKLELIKDARVKSE